MSPLVSVIVPCYNQGRYLPDALDSLIAQTTELWDCVLVNDGSTDDTRDVALAYAARDKRIRYVEQANRGLSAARNLGIEHAAGDVFQFLDCDDRLENAKIERHASFLDSHPAVGIVYGDVRYFRTEFPDERGYGPYADGSNRPWVPERWHAEGPMLMKLARRNVMAVNCALVRRAVFERVGRWNESLRALEDWEFWIRSAAAGVRFQYIDDPGALALVRLHDGSMTRDAIRMNASLFRMRVELCSQVTHRRFRRLNAILGIAEASHLGAEGRRSRLMEMGAADRRLGTVARAVWELVFGLHGPGYPVASLLERLCSSTIPWPIQRFVKCCLTRSRSD